MGENYSTKIIIGKTSMGSFVVCTESVVESNEKRTLEFNASLTLVKDLQARRNVYRQ